MLVVFGGYDHYRPTMTHLLHGLLQQCHAGLVVIVLGESHGLVTTLLGRKGRCEEGERYEVRQWYGARVGEEATCWVAPGRPLTLSQDLVEHPTYVYFSESSR